MIKKLQEFIKSKITLPGKNVLIAGLFVVVIIGSLLYFLKTFNDKSLTLQKQLAQTQKNLVLLQNQDQYKINQDQKKEILSINKSFKNAVSAYQQITDLDAQKGKTDDMKKNLAKVLAYLADRNYASADATLISLNSDIQKENARIAATVANSNGLTINTASLPSNNAPPGSGFSRQAVSALGSSYVVDIVAGDMDSTRVIVDSASDSDCHDSCPVMALGDYISRNGAYAGVNGSYFCPADYPSCAGKSNTFDTLLMNVRKHYLNSDNNVYSTVPAVIFQSGSMRFVGASQDWGRDTGPDGVLANQPLLVSGGNVVFGGDGDPKKGSKGNRSFVANKGNTAYIGVVHNVTVAESAQVLKAMGMDNALNLDSGGSTALFANGGYQDGPGRNIPNAILFVRK